MTSLFLPFAVLALVIAKATAFTAPKPIFGVVQRKQLLTPVFTSSIESPSVSDTELTDKPEGRVPNLENYFKNGYSCRTSDFLRNTPIFNVDYDAGDVIYWGSADTQVTIPAGIVANTVTTFEQSAVTTLLESMSDYDSSFSAAVDVEYTGATFSGSGSSSLLFTSGLFSSTKTSNALDFQMARNLKFSRATPTTASLSNDFINAVNNLVDNNDPDHPKAVTDASAYVAFLQEFGTHYVESGSMGGTVVMSTTVDDKLFTEKSSDEVTAAITAGFNGLVASGSLSANAAYSSSSILDKYKSEITVTVQVMGGIVSGDDKGAWQTSLFDSPILLLFNPIADNENETPLSTLKSVSNLVPLAVREEYTEKNSHLADDIQQMIVECLHTFVAEDSSQDGIVGSTKSVNFSQAYKLAASYLYMVNLMATKNGDRSESSIHKNSLSTGLLGGCSLHNYTTADTHVPCSSLAVPVAPETMIIAKTEATSGSPSMTLSRVSLGTSAEVALDGEHEDSEPATSEDFTHQLNKDMDGLLLLQINNNGVNGGRGYIQVKCDDSGELEGGASCHYYTTADTHVPMNSATVPILKDKLYTITKKTTSSGSSGSWRFVPFKDAFDLSAGEDRDANVAYQATTDGFFVAFLNERKNGDRGELKMLQHKDEDYVKNEALSTQASTSIHYYDNKQNKKYEDTYVPMNTAMIPVVKGNFYSAAYKATSGNPNISVKFYPLTMNTNGD